MQNGFCSLREPCLTADGLCRCAVAVSRPTVLGKGLLSTRHIQRKTALEGLGSSIKSPVWAVNITLSTLYCGCNFTLAQEILLIKLHLRELPQSILFL